MWRSRNVVQKIQYTAKLMTTKNDTRAKLTNPDVRLELAESLHRTIRCVDERRAPCRFDGGAPRFCHTT